MRFSTVLLKMSEKLSPQIANSALQKTCLKLSAPAVRPLTLKTPKGTRDSSGSHALIRQRIINVLVECCKSRDAELLESPHLEIKEILESKYGEEQKLIYHLENFEGENLSLRYDLTVPFARYLAANKITNMRRYQYGKVFRRDNPKMNRGRMREFYQFDFDIAGEYDKMVPDSECIYLMADALSKLKMNFIIKVNHRKLLEGVLSVCGINTDKLKTVCSSIDKLDKREWEEVRDELINVKGIPCDIVDKIGEHVKLEGDFSRLEEIKGNASLFSNQMVQVGVSELQLLYTYLEAFGVEKTVRFDLSLARGLDYYTGVIYEAVLTGYKLKDPNTGEDISIGSVAAGGRYDGLVSGFDSGSNQLVPCVGLSFGVERLATIAETQLNDSKSLRPTETDIYITSPQKGFLIERMKLATMLINAGFKVGFCPKQKAKFLTQVQYCESKQIPICLIISQSEISEGVVKVRHVQSRLEESVARDELIQYLRDRLESEKTQNEI